MKGMFLMKKCEQCGFENEDTENFCTECGKPLDNDENIEAPSEEDVITVDNTEEDTAAEVCENESEPSENTESESELPESSGYTGFENTGEAETGYIEKAAEPKKPMSPAAKKGICAAAVIIAAAALFYFFGSLGFMSRIGIVNSQRYINKVCNRMISETDDSPSVKLGTAFDTFFAEENNKPKWSVSKTDGGVEVKCETDCNFDGQEKTYAVYKVVYDYSNNITSEAFSAADKTLDGEETASVLKKIARYSDPAKSKFTSKLLSSSKYNNAVYYYPTGMTAENMAQMYNLSLGDFLEKSKLPADMEGSTDLTVVQLNITLGGIASMSGITFDELKTQMELDDTANENMLLADYIYNKPLSESGVTAETFDKIKENYGFDDSVTLDTLYRDVMDYVTKKQFDMDEEAKNNDNSESTAEPESTEASETAAPQTDSNTENAE